MKKRYWKKADVKTLLKEVATLEAERARWSEDRGSSEALAEALGRIELMKTVQADTEAELNKLRVEHTKLRDTHSKLKPNGAAQHDTP